jgi:hypothetical protein
MAGEQDRRESGGAEKLSPEVKNDQGETIPLGLFYAFFTKCKLIFSLVSVLTLKE